MNPEYVEKLSRGWDAAAHAEGREHLLAAVRTALGSVPDPGVWAISEDAAVLWVLVPGEILFTVHAAEDGRVTTVSRPLQPNRLVVSLEWGDVQTSETGDAVRETTWAFRYLDERELNEPWQQITGRVGIEAIDPREKLARAIAARAGWQVNEAVSPDSAPSWL
jgi:hypothetical protein